MNAIAATHTKTSTSRVKKLPDPSIWLIFPPYSNFSQYVGMTRIEMLGPCILDDTWREDELHAHTLEEKKMSGSIATLRIKYKTFFHLEILNNVEKTVQLRKQEKL